MSASEDDLNNIMAAGAVFMALSSDGVHLDDVDIVSVNGQATNQLTIQLDFMKSLYRVTVERIPDD